MLSELLGRKNWFAITTQAVAIARELGLDDGDATLFALRRAQWCLGKRNNDGAYPLATARDVVKWKGDHEALMGRAALEDEKERQRALQRDAESRARQQRLTRFLKRSLSPLRTPFGDERWRSRKGNGGRKEAARRRVSSSIERGTTRRRV